MKSYYPRIAHKLYKEPWLIVPSVHELIRKQFEAHIKGPKADVSDIESELEQEQVQPLVNGVGILPIYGVLGCKLSLLETMCGGADVQAIAKDLKTLRDDPNCTAIVLDFDSPGGTVTGIPELAELIAETDKVKPVYGYTSGQVCSAAYWLASQCRNLIAAPSSSVGSIGVYIYLEDSSQAYAKAGIKPDPIVSEGSPYKLMGADWQALTKDERAMLQADVDKLKTQFVNAIQSKRAVKPNYLQGQVVDGNEAAEGGLVDGTANDLDAFLSLLVPVLTPNTR